MSRNVGERGVGLLRNGYGGRGFLYGCEFVGNGIVGVCCYVFCY